MNPQVTWIWAKGVENNDDDQISLTMESGWYMDSFWNCNYDLDALGKEIYL